MAKVLSFPAARVSAPFPEALRDTAPVSCGVSDHFLCLPPARRYIRVQKKMAGMRVKSKVGPEYNSTRPSRRVVSKEKNGWKERVGGLGVNGTGWCDGPMECSAYAWIIRTGRIQQRHTLTMNRVNCWTSCMSLLTSKPARLFDPRKTASGRYKSSDREHPLPSPCPLGLCCRLASQATNFTSRPFLGTPVMLRSPRRC